MKPTLADLLFTSFDEYKHTSSGAVLASVLIQFCPDINNSILPLKKRKSLKLICGGRFGMFGGLAKPQDSVHRAWGDSSESWEGRNVNRIMRLQMVIRTVRNLMRCHWCCILANNSFTFCLSLKLRGILSFKIVDWLLWWRTFMEPQRRDTWVRLTECHRQISYKQQKLT